MTIRICLAFAAGVIAGVAAAITLVIVLDDEPFEWDVDESDEAGA